MSGLDDLPPGQHEPHEPRPSSRRGGAILLSTIGALIVAAVVVLVVTSGSGRKAPQRPQHSGTTSGAASGSRTGKATGATTATTTGATTGSGSATRTTTTATSQILAQLNLKSPTGARSTLGIVQVIREGGAVGIALAAQGMPANTRHNAYAVWLYNSPTSYRFVGFVQYLVGKNGKIDTSGTLKRGAAAYHHLVITLETRSHPRHPGEIVLYGPFREHP
ncbi:MAG: hypothetical protein KGL15_11350 [Acidobacteriota bacterium]|nr:hypothetical protein [Acidobacteriota bacterium]